jgi:hypothetical protein
MGTGGRVRYGARTDEVWVQERRGMGTGEKRCGTRRREGRWGYEHKRVMSWHAKTDA